MQSSLVAVSTSKKAKAAGIMCIISGILFIISILAGSWFIWALADAFTEPGGTSSGIPYPVVAAFTIPFSIVGIVAIIGGIMATRLRRWWLAMVGSICAFFGFFPLGVVSIVLLILARYEFNK